MLTRLGNRHNICNIRHKDAALELEFRVLVARLGPSGFRLVLLVFDLSWHHLLAAEQNALEEIYLVLGERMQSSQPRRGGTLHMWKLTSFS